jgi:pyruvate dehydrogenase E2 component (dihydrolipoamide acetyltransferase)
MHTPNEVIMPVLGMVQETGKIIRWLVEEGARVEQGQPLFEVETDKAVAEIEAPVSGILSGVKAHQGDEVPVGEVIAVILLPEGSTNQPVGEPAAALEAKSRPAASPVAARMAAEKGIDISMIRPQGSRVEKADVLAYLQARQSLFPSPENSTKKPARPLASPKARRLAAERGLDLAMLKGSGPEGAVRAIDFPSAFPAASPKPAPDRLPQPPPLPAAPADQDRFEEFEMSSMWRIMVERTTSVWREAPHFFLLREVDAGRLLSWREMLAKKNQKVTYTDLLVKLVAAALQQHPRANAAVKDGKVYLMDDINIGIAVAVEDGLVVPVIHRANECSLAEIAASRSALVDKARFNKLRPEDISGGTFTISNLGMFGVDTFLAVLNPPQAAILAVGRIVERVVPVGGQPAVRPMMALSLSFDHRALDGARGAQFLDTLSGLIEEPLGLMD